MPKPPPENYRWKPGQSGNPAGRKQGVERRFREVAESRVYVAKDGTSHAGVDALAHAMLDIALDRNEEAKDRRAAIDSYVDRGWGKVKQEVELSGEASSRTAVMVTMSDEQLRALAVVELAEADPDAPTEH